MVAVSNFLSLQSLYHYLQNGDCDGCLLRSIQWRHFQRVKGEDTTLPLHLHVLSLRPTWEQISVATLSSSNVHRNIGFLYESLFNTEWLYIGLLKSHQRIHAPERIWITQDMDKWNNFHSETYSCLDPSIPLRALNHYKFHMSILIN
jgi:hypothetical protein